MTQYGFYFDATRCTGCKTCVLACKDAKDLACDQAFRQVYEFETAGDWTQDASGSWTCASTTYYVSSACNHCDNPACVAACPQGSMVKDPETGLVYNDPATCIGCGACAMACPYGAPAIDDQQQISIKCDGCHGLLENGEMPVCVASCPSRALECGPIEDLRATYGSTAAIAPLPDPTQTSPNVVIAPCHNAVEVAGDGVVANEVELV